MTDKIGPDHKYALVNPESEVVRIEGNIDPTVGTKKGWRWLPYEEQTAAPEKDQAVESETVVLEEKVVLTKTVRDMTPEEIDQRDAKLREFSVARVLADPTAKLLRSVVEDDKPMPDADWKDWIEARL